MSNKGKFFVGGAIIGAFVLVGCFVLMLYMIPSFKPMGMSGVYIQSKYMTYYGEDVDYLFAQKNFIIKSDKTDVVISVGSAGYADQGRIQLFEDANGIAFNSRSRTQIDLYETWHLGEAYSVIHVREPRGAVARDATMYVNLISDNCGLGSGDPSYNFVLNTKGGDVSFRKDTDANGLKVNNMWVNGTGKVTYFSDPLVARVNNLYINNDATVDCRANVGSVMINADAKKVTLGEVENSISVTGKTNNVTVRRVNVGGVTWTGDGTLTINDYVGGAVNVLARSRMNITATNANIGSLSYKSIKTLNDPNIRDITGTVNVGRIRGNVTVDMHDGSLTLGSASARNNGKGSIRNYPVEGELEMGCYGFVKIQKRSGNTNVNYAKDATTLGQLDCFATFGTVSVWGIKGLCIIDFATWGDANVNVAFAQVTGGSKISFLEQSFNASKKFGQATVTFLNECGCSLTIIGSRERLDYISPLVNGKPQTWGVNGVAGNIYGGGASLIVKDAQDVFLRPGSWT